MPIHELLQSPIKVSSGGAKVIGLGQIDERAFYLLVGGGNATFRKQMKILADFINSFDFVKMQPVIPNTLGKEVRARGLAEPGRQYAFYLHGGINAALAFDLPSGKYRAEWVNVCTGKIDKRETVNHPGGEVTLIPPAYDKEITLRLRR